MDLAGNRYGNLTVVRETDRIKEGKQYVRAWISNCDCGSTLVTKQSALTRGTATSCGCVRIKKLDITGQKFSRLTVIGPSDKKDRWICECECGVVKDYLRRALTSGGTKSCGCYLLETKSYLSPASFHGYGGHPLYDTWKQMRSRIVNQNNSAYHNYGGRGLSMDVSWREGPTGFIEWAENSGWYKGCGLSLDRIDNDKGYFPDNCKFSNRTEQNTNQRIQTNNTSGYKGIHLNKKSGNWVARISVDQKRVALGSYADIKDAVRARQLAEIKYFGKILHPEQSLLADSEIEMTMNNRSDGNNTKITQ